MQIRRIAGIVVSSVILFGAHARASALSFEERVAAQLFGRRSLIGEDAAHDPLGGDRSVVHAGQPQCMAGAKNSELLVRLRRAHGMSVRAGRHEI